MTLLELFKGILSLSSLSLPLSVFLTALHCSFMQCNEILVVKAKIHFICSIYVSVQQYALIFLNI